jgi:hypothetical protein
MSNTHCSSVVNTSNTPANAFSALILLGLSLLTAPGVQAQAPRMAAGMRAMQYTPPVMLPIYLDYNGKYAAAPPGTPLTIARAVAAANDLQGKPYIWGGGHRKLNDRGYDCSGSVSYVLFKAGVLRGPLTARQFRGYGAPGPGRFLSIYVSGEHVFLSICGLRFDTSDKGARRGDGPKWRPTARSFPGFEIRHIPGL